MTLIIFHQVVRAWLYLNLYATFSIPGNKMVSLFRAVYRSEGKTNFE